MQPTRLPLAIVLFASCGSDRTSVREVTPPPAPDPAPAAAAQPGDATPPTGMPLAPGERLLDPAATATWQRADGAVELALVVKAPEPGAIRCCGEHVVMRTRQAGVVAEDTVSAALDVDDAYAVTVDVVGTNKLLSSATDSHGGSYNLRVWHESERRLGPERGEYTATLPAWVTAACKQGCRRLLEIRRQGG